MVKPTTSLKMKVLLVCISLFLLCHKFAWAEFRWLTPCMDDDDCNDLKNSTCSGGLCMCGNASYLCESRSYVVSNKMGGHCEEDRNCNLFNSMCGPEKKCVCKEGFVASVDSRKCLKATSELGGPCIEDVQCRAVIIYGICQNGACQCQNSTHNFNGWCLKSRALGEECYQNEECLTASSSCTKLRCTCLEGHVAVNGKCLRVAQDMGDTCEKGIQCTAAFGDGSHCSKGICQCRDHYQFKAVTSACVRDIFFGEMCATDSECNPSGIESSRLRCLAGVCKCKAEYREEDGFCSGTVSAERKLRSSAVLASGQHLLIVFTCLSLFYMFHFRFSIAC